MMFYKILLIISFLIISPIIQCNNNKPQTKNQDFLIDKTRIQKSIFNNYEKSNETEEEVVSPCETPDFDNGYCININKCRSYQGISPEKLDQTTFCGSTNPEFPANLKVCCDINQIGLPDNPDDSPKCGTQKILSQRIMGGNETELGEFPWMARLIYKDKFDRKTASCAAFLIHPQFVITAAHCLFVGDKKVYEVHLGEHNTDTKIDCDLYKRCADEIQQIKVQNVWIHHKFRPRNRNYLNDVAVIQLVNNARITDFVRPICLTKKINAYPEYWTSGWGRTEHYYSSAVKLKVSLTHSPINYCVDKHAEMGIRLNNKRQRCTGAENGKDTCMGDSGGPLMVVEGKRWYAVGIVSFGLVRCGNAELPSVYTNLPRYVRWIQGVIQNATLN